MYLYVSDGTGGALVILQRRGRNGPTGIEGLGEWRHLGSRRDLHAGELGGIQLLWGGRNPLTSKSSIHSKSYSLSFPLHMTLCCFCVGLHLLLSLSLSFTSFLSFHEAGREPPSKVLTVFQRLNPERDSSLKNHTEMALIQNTWSPYFPLITEKS